MYSESQISTQKPPLEVVLSTLKSEFLTLQSENLTLREQNLQLQRQLDWFRRQIFGKKSERNLIDMADHLSLFDLSAPPPDVSAPTTSVAPYQRRKDTKANGAPDGLFFDESKVPVEVIELPAPEAAGLTPDDYEVVSEKISHRLAQRPASYVILKYVRPVIKLKSDAALVCAPAPESVISGSRADVSFLAGLVVDKAVYHLPLYRQHQRLSQAGFNVSRPWLTQLFHGTLKLLTPVADAQLQSIRESRVISMDETPIKAGQGKDHTMKTGYFWPVYGDQDEVNFLFFGDRRHARVSEALGMAISPDQVLLSDGYQAYENYARTVGLTHAQCWVHTRRQFVEALPVEPEEAGRGLNLIGQIYAIEQAIRDAGVSGAEKRSWRRTHTTTVVDEFFTWAKKRWDTQNFLPSSPLTKALAYAREREVALRVFLDDPDVAPDTNHLERALRVIPVGRRNWNFCWTEVGAELMGVAQSLMVTCKLQGVDPYVYLVDVLQRIQTHPNRDVAQLTPRLWKQHFAANPMGSDLKFNTLASQGP